MSDSRERPDASRRRLLAAVGAVGATLTAGCGGFGGGSGDSGSGGSPTQTTTTTTTTETTTATETTTTTTETTETTETTTTTTGTPGDGRLAVGETFAAPTGVRATVERVEIRKRSENGTRRTAPSGQPVRVPEGQQAVAVQFRARNTGDAPQAAPDPSAITVRAGGRTFEAVGVGQIPDGYTGGSLDPGASASGWLLYLLPEAIPQSEMSVVWEGSGGGRSWTATWAVGGQSGG